MTAYSPIADSEIDPESPGTTTLFTKLRNNPIAITEKASGAPVLANDYIVTAMIEDGAVTVAKLSDYAAGSYVDGNIAYRTGADLGLFGVSYAKEIEIKVPRGGTITTRMGVAETNAGAGVRAKIYVNGIAVGTERSPVTSTSNDWFWYNENISVNAGDLVQIYARESGAAYSAGLCLAIMCSDSSTSGSHYTDVHILNKSNGHLFNA